MTIDKLLIISASLLLGACDILEEDSNKISDLKFSNDRISECVQQTAIKHGWTKVTEYEVLDCGITNTPFSNEDLVELRVFTNLSSFFIGQPNGADSEFLDFDGRFFPNLITFSCADCQFSSLAFNSIEGLRTIKLYDSYLPDYLDLTGNNILTELRLYRTNVNEVILPPENSLREFELRGDVDIEQPSLFINLDTASQLVSATIYGVEISTLNIDSDSLRELRISWSNIGDLDVKSSSLKNLYCLHCNLDKFNPTDLPAIELLNFYNNNLLDIDVSQNIALSRLNLEQNPLLQSTKDYLDSLELDVYYSE